MSRNENNDIVNDEIIESRPTKNNINLETLLIIICASIRNVAPVECDVCGCIVVNRAFYNQNKSGKCKLVKQFKDIAKLEHDELQLIQYST